MDQPRIATSTDLAAPAQPEKAWGHFSQMERALKQGARVIVRAEGARVYDDQGKEYIDGLSGLFTVNVGHGREEIKQAIVRQLDQIEYFSMFMNFTNEPAIRLAEKLGQIAPPGLEYAFFCTGGSEAVETAFKMARQYFYNKGEPKRYKIISRRWAYHGQTMGALSANGATYQRAPFEPLVPGFSRIGAPYCYRCEWGQTYGNCAIQCAQALEREILDQGADQVAAFIAEPVIGSLGIIPPPPEYWPLVREICDKYGVLLIADEVICGFGRTGKLFASEHWNVVPDIMTIAKGLGSGYVPIAAAVTRREIYEQFLGSDSDMFLHGLTFGGHPVACAAALANIEILEREQLAERAAATGQYLLDALKPLERYPIVGEVRGLGMLIGIELVKDKQSREKDTERKSGVAIAQMAYEAGVICRSNLEVVGLAPPLTLSQDEADRVIDVLHRAFERVVNELEG